MPERRFTLIVGEGSGRESKPNVDLTLVPCRPIASEQLMLLPWLHTPAGSRPTQASKRLLSAGLDTLDFHGFRSILERTRVKRVLDIRLLASFRGNGFSHEAVDRAFAEFGVEYERSVELANAFVGSSPNPQVVLQRYGEHLRRECEGTLHKLMNWLQSGPVLLLGRGPIHFGAERELITNCIAETSFPLEVLVFQSCRGDTVEASGYIIGPRASTAANHTGRSKSAKRMKRRKRAQLGLPNTDEKPRD